jgi:hypothetical protein
MATEATQCATLVSLLAQIEQKFGVKLLWNKLDKFTGYRDAVTRTWFFHAQGESLAGDLKLNIRRFVQSQGWQWSRQVPKS